MTGIAIIETATATAIAVKSDQGIIVITGPVITTDAIYQDRVIEEVKRSENLGTMMMRATDISAHVTRMSKETKMTTLRNDGTSTPTETKMNLLRPRRSHRRNLVI